MWYFYVPIDSIAQTQRRFAGLIGLFVRGCNPVTGRLYGENAFPKRWIGLLYPMFRQTNLKKHCNVGNPFQNCSHPLPELDHYVAREACSILVAAGVHSLASLMHCLLPVSSSRPRSTLVPERTNAHCQEHGGVNAFNGTCSRECWFAFAKMGLPHYRGNYFRCSLIVQMKIGYIS